MSYISPNSDVRLLTNIPFDRGYNHTKNFWGSDYLNDQANYFINFTKNLNGVTYAYSSQSYQRVNKNTIRLAVLADNIYDCNYMMFRNTAYGNKWFYAFIDSINYINDNCTEISYTIDVLQTWFFDYDIKACFVEREHAVSDEIGDNLVPENLEIGDLEIYDDGYEKFNYFLGGIVLSKPFPQVIPTTNPEVTVDFTGVGGGTWAKYQLSYTFTGDAVFGTSGQAPCGIPNGLWILTGFVATEEDISHWSNNNEYLNYNIQSWTPSTSAASGYNTNLTLGRLLDFIGAGYISGLSGDDIVTAFTYPAELNLKSNITLARNYAYRNGVALHFLQNGARPTAFKDYGSSVLYYPKNNKLFTFPYVQLTVSNNVGDTITYKYEEMNSGYSNPSFTPSFRWVGNYTPEPTVCLVPSMQGVSDNYEHSLTIGNFPKPAYKSTQYAQWLEQNSNKFCFGLVSTALRGLSNYAAPVAPKIPISINDKHRKEKQLQQDAQDINTAINRYRIAGSTAESIGSSLAQVADIAHMPPTVSANFTTDSLNMGVNKVGFRFYSMGIRKQYAIKIDDYFTMYGYATKSCKIPNVMHRESGEKIRNNFMYTKTIGALVTPKFGSGLPAEDIEEIQAIFDKGVTFWRNDTVCGNYTVDNSIITIS